MSNQTKLPYRIYRTAFHGGGLVSRHHTQELAEVAASKFRRGDCVCGCCAVLGPGEVPADAEYNRNIAHNPYAIVD